MALLAGSLRMRPAFTGSMAHSSDTYIMHGLFFGAGGWERGLAVSIALRLFRSPVRYLLT